MGRNARLKRERRARAHRVAAAGVVSVGLPATGAQRKLSDSLLELVEPLRATLDPHEQTLERLEHILRVGAIAWNAGLVPDGDGFMARACAVHDPTGEVSCWSKSHFGEVGTGVTGLVATPQTVLGL